MVADKAHELTGQIIAGLAALQRSVIVPLGLVSLSDERLPDEFRA
jgi:hypothetical protein